MTNKKKNVKKNNPIKKETTKKEVKKEEVKKDETIKDFIIIVLVLTIAFLVIWALTLGAKRLGWFNQHYSKPEVEDAIISYDNIELGTIFNRSESEYYVALFDGEKDEMYLNTLITNYKEKENALKVYIVDLSEGLNSSALSEENNTNTSKVNELKINDTTLIHVRNGQNIEAIVGIDNIANALK